MKAPITEQLRLLDLQAQDTRLDQLDHQVAHLPERESYDALVAEQAALDADLLRATAAAEDAGREQRRAEADVSQVRERAARTQARLEAGTGTAKELQSLQAELESLARRQSDLEDVELETMERAEGLAADAERAAQRSAELKGRLDAARRDLESAITRLETERDSTVTERSAIAPEVSEPLLNLYTKIRGTSGGVAVAALVGKRCGGCRLELDPGELAAIKAAEPEEVVRCEDCRRIIVRAQEQA